MNEKPERNEVEETIIELAERVWEEIGDETKIKWISSSTVSIERESGHIDHFHLNSVLANWRSAYDKKDDVIYVKGGRDGWVKDPNSGYARYIRA